MRVTRDWLFDYIELVGKAIAGVRSRRAGPEWDLDDLISGFIDRWRMNRDRIERSIEREAQEEDDHWGLGIDWKDSADDGTSGPLGDRPRKEYSRWGSEAFEQKRAQGYYDDFGDAISCRLWEIQRRLRFKEMGVLDTAKELQEMLHKLKGYVSAGWANSLAAIIDQASP